MSLCVNLSGTKEEAWKVLEEYERQLQQACAAAEEHKYFMNILNDEIKYLNSITEELIEEGFNIEEMGPTSDLMLSHLGYELLAEPEERPVVEPCHRRQQLNWAFQHYGAPFKKYEQA